MENKILTSRAVQCPVMAEALYCFWRGLQH